MCHKEYYENEGCERFIYEDDFIENELLRNFINKLNNDFYNQSYDINDRDYLEIEIDIFVETLNDNTKEIIINTYNQDIINILKDRIIICNEDDEDID
jgi:hypothetical protein